MWLRSAVVSSLYQHHEMQYPLQCYNFSCVACSMFVYDLLPINVMVACLHVHQVSGAPFWHFRSVIGMYRAGGSFVLLSARNVALLTVRMHSDLSNSGASGKFVTLWDTSGNAGGMQRASAFILGAVVRTCRSGHIILNSTLRNFL
jgi:hypothetical protein